MGWEETRCGFVGCAVLRANERSDQGDMEDIDDNDDTGGDDKNNSVTMSLMTVGRFQSRLRPWCTWPCASSATTEVQSPGPACTGRARRMPWASRRALLFLQ